MIPGRPLAWVKYHSEEKFLSTTQEQNILIVKRWAILYQLVPVPGTVPGMLKVPVLSSQAAISTHWKHQSQWNAARRCGTTEGMLQLYFYSPTPHFQ